MNEDIGQHKDEVSVDDKGLNISDSKGYQAVIKDNGEITFKDNNGHELNTDLSLETGSVKYKAGNSSISVNTDKEIEMSTEYGRGSVTTISRINENGKIVVEKTEITGTAVSVGNFFVSVEVGAKLTWTPEKGWELKNDSHVKFLGMRLEEIADNIYTAVVKSDTAQILASRDDYYNYVENCVIEGKPYMTQKEWLEERRKSGVSPETNTNFSNANSFVERRDPLSLDLDGDGIETVGANAGITFDFDGDGLKTGTGWVKGDDGFLVLDRNGNGQIDNGGELFGVDTVKANGQKATDGFDALKDFDSNGDGVFDAQDTQFANVKIWQDTNQDGIAQNGELKTLAGHNIVAINLDAKASNHNSNGNLISAVGSFVRGDGSEGTVNANQSLAANLDLASNPFYREFTDPIALDDAAKALPDMKGSGAVRDLREASMLNAELKTLLATYAQAQTREEQMGLLDKLIAEWAESSGYRTFDQRISALDTDQIRFAFSYSWEKPDQDKLQTGSGGSSGGLVTTNEKESNKTPTAVQLDQKATLEKIKILEVFNSQNFFNFNHTEQNPTDNKNGRTDLSVRLGSILRTMGSVSLSGQATYYITEADLSPTPAQTQFINSAYDALKQSIYDGLLLQTRFTPLTDSISLHFGTNNLHLSLNQERVNHLFNDSPLATFLNLLEFQRINAGKTLIGSLIDSIGKLAPKLSAENMAQVYLQFPDLMFGTSEADKLRATGVRNSVFGGDGNDTLEGLSGNDKLYGGEGNDSLLGGLGDDLLEGGTGNDILHGEDGNDTLRGGLGNDTLIGGYGNDTYLFNLGDGQDTLVESDGYWTTDVLRFGEGILPSDISITRSGNDLVLQHANGQDRITAQNWFVATRGYGNANQLDSIIFADGTVWDAGTISLQGLTINGSEEAERIVGVNDYSDLLYGNAGNDTLEGLSGNDKLYGGEGNDSLLGGLGDDLLEGGTGNDILHGEDGNDTLRGGLGNDTLIGGYGNDTYLFNLGDGQDTLVESDGYWTTDVLRFGEGILPSDISITRSGNDLVLQHANGQDRITAQNWFVATRGYGNANQLDSIIFADGTVWDAGTISLQGLTINGSEEAERIVGVNDYSDLLYGNAGNDTLEGLSGNDKLYGGEGNDSLLGGLGDDLLEGGTGNDILHGEDGNDTLRGGLGNDTLIGGYGNDTYLFNLGDGQDTLVESDGYWTTDVLRFGEGILPSDISITRSGNDLVLQHANGQDRITAQNWFVATRGYGNANQLDSIIFADGTVWDAGTISLQGLTINGSEEAERIVGVNDYSDLLYGNAGNDTLEGLSGNDKLYGGEGNDSLLGGLGDDLLEGGTGNDILHGEDGNDTLRGGLGNDTLIGGYGNDTYLFNLGDGQDTLVESDGYWTTDVLRFGEGILPSDISITRSGNDLVLQHANGQDRITAQNWFVATRGYGNANQLDSIIFADGTVWDAGTISLQGLTINGSEEAERIVGVNDYSDLLYGNAGNDTLEGLSGNDKLYGGEGNDSLLGGLGDDLLEGGTGNDILHGEDGNDTLRGGLGNDTLIGGYGNDTYLFNLGDGQDTLVESDGYWTTDVLRFGEGILPSDISITRSGNDLVLQHANGQDRITAQNWFVATRGYGNANQLDSIIFADGTVWDAGTISLQGLTINGSEEAERIVGVNDYSDLLYGNAGNDTLEGLSGNDKLYGGEGNDSLLGGLGDDLLEGGTGNDILHGEDGNDTLRGGLGNDTLIGGYGNDTYLFNLGDGQDTLVESDGYWTTDVLRFGEGILPSDISITRSGNDLVLQHANGQDRITAQNWFVATRGYGNANQLDSIIFADGTVWDAGTISLQGLTINGSEEAERIVGVNDYSDLLYGNAGNDTLEGLSGNDKLYGGEGNDSLLGGLGDDLLEGGTGNDILHGEDGNDTLRGGLGNDTLIGGYGNDTYLFNLGDGQDTLVESDGYWTTDVLRFGEGILPSDISITRSGNDLVLQHANGQDRITAQNWFVATRGYGNANQLDSIIFADGTVWDAGTISLQGLTINGSEEAERIVGVNDYSDLLYGNAGNDTLEGLSGNDKLYGGEGNDSLLGGLGDDLLEGGTGNDILHGEDGNDTLRGGLGNDTLIGGYGNDTYLFNLGDGQDTLVESDGYWTTDVLRFGEGILPSDISITRSGNDLVLQHANGQDRITAQNWFVATRGYGNANQLDSIIFADGTVWDAGTISLQGLTINGSEEAERIVGVNDYSDLLYGNAGNDTLEGLSGNDKLYGGEGNDSLLGGLGDDLLEGGTGNDILHGEDGNDTLRGGLGNDTLIGGYGNDTYLFNLGDGQDVIQDGYGNDVLSFEQGINSTDLWLQRTGNNLELSVLGSDDKVTISNWYANASNHVETIKTADGKTLLDSQVQNLVNAMAAFAPPTAGNSNLTPEQRAQLEVVIAANWH
ncbi:hypothetical protein WP8S17C03_35600 [Metapseudomonas otitidis]|uniref:Haemolysin-type calcium binding-related domain-containing protein n=1 Tax=Metapseudomonas otitidis TaxID=319939 RepID=A0A6S5RN15_9GAMM|nr:calcium-binding protein [Pseudomonas otitidis]BBT17511.1 hypothetical protein WP8S17C03_35600 [Pseudomonas otitidis]